MDGKDVITICFGGFCVLMGWCWYLNTKYAVVASMKEKVDDIHKVLMGDLQNEGWISKARRIEEQCKIRHGEADKRI